jgi:hypothetical protein
MRVNRFQQSPPGLALYFDRQSNDPLRQLSMFEHGNTFAALRGPRDFSVLKMKEG